MATTRLLAGARVLLVDDEPDALMLVERFLAAAGATALLATNVDEAMMELERRPDIIVSDIAMPGGDGYHLMRCVRARSIDRGGATPAIALTARASKTDHSLALLAGFQVHLAKPIKATELVASIHQLLAPLASVTR